MLSYPHRSERDHAAEKVNCFRLQTTKDYRSEELSGRPSVPHCKVQLGRIMTTVYCVRLSKQQFSIDSPNSLNGFDLKQNLNKENSFDWNLKLHVDGSYVMDVEPFTRIDT